MVRVSNQCKMSMDNNMTKKWRVILMISLIGNLAIVYVAFKALEYRSHINHFLDKYVNVVAEFSGRSLYAESNRKFSPPGPDVRRVVFFGTQVIENWDLDSYFSGIEAINRGLSGQRAAGFLLRFRPDVLDLHPAAVVIEVSSYNFRPETTVNELQDYVLSMAELARLHKIEPVLTTVIPPRQGVVSLGTYSIMDSLAVYNDWIRRITRDRNYACLDLDSLLADDKGFLPLNLSSGDIDPNEAGYRRISHAASGLLLKLLSSDVRF